MKIFIILFLFIGSLLAKEQDVTLEYVKQIELCASIHSSLDTLEWAYKTLAKPHERLVDYFAEYFKDNDTQYILTTIQVLYSCYTNQKNNAIFDKDRKASFKFYAKELENFIPYKRNQEYNKL